MDGLTPEQRIFAEHDGEVFVVACPGAGKTRTVVQRFGRIAGRLPPRRAIAVLSFTHAAVEEFTKSCHAAGLPHLLQFPNYVGTFDGFVRHFIILPFGVDGSSVRPLVLDSWDSLGIEVRLDGDKKYWKGTSLDLFDPETNSIDPSRIGIQGLRSHVIQHQPEYETRACSYRNGLHRKGFLSSTDARVLAKRRISDPAWGERLGKALTARFAEIIVDEAQDCNPCDLDILRWLRENGIPVTVVCDPDQAIYEFRHGEPCHLRAFGDTYAKEDRKSLSGNFRSSRPVCMLAATLRTDRNSDNPVGKTATITHPVKLVTYPGRSDQGRIGTHFLRELDRLGIPPGDAIILAHAHKTAQRATGDPLHETPSGASRVEGLARAVGEFWSPSSTGRRRESALLAVEKSLLDVMGLWSPGDRHPARAVERAGLHRRELRRKAMYIVCQLPRTCGSGTDAGREWVNALRGAVGELRLPLPETQSIPRFFPYPGKDQWAKHLAPPVNASIRCSTVHEAKGREFGAVCVVIPPDRAPDRHTSSLFDAWESGSDHEGKRVIYVGVTRAQSFVMLAVPQSFAQRSEAILKQYAVPFERSTLEAARE